MENMKTLAINYNYGLAINTAPAAAEPTMEALSAGFDNLGKALNEALYQGSFLGDGGYGSTEVTGGQLILTLSGVRMYGDPAQDYIFSDAVKNNFGNARKTNFELTYPNGDKISGNITLAKITEGGGASASPDAITVEIHFNGKPKFVAAEKPTSPETPPVTE